MAPKELVGRYKQYKHGTQDLVYWLTKTAAECGDLGDVVRYVKFSWSIRRGISAAERRAQQRVRAAAAAASHWREHSLRWYSRRNDEGCAGLHCRFFIYPLTSCSSLGKVLPARPSGHRFAVPDLEVRSHEIVTLAQQIANSKKSVEIPEGILLILRDVIAGRKGCAAWYDSQADGEGSQKSKADEGHQAFIEVSSRYVLRANRGLMRSLRFSKRYTASSPRPGREMPRPMQARRLGRSRRARRPVGRLQTSSLALSVAWVLKNPARNSSETQMLRRSR